jgi:Domain of unknown function (DUF5916)
VRVHCRSALSVGLLALSLAAAATAARANDARPVLRAMRVVEEGAIRVDGRLDEGAWKQAPVTSDFQQREPLEGVPASEATEVRVLYDPHILYVGILARDREPQRIIARTLRRDRVMEPDLEGKYGFAGDDALAILFDTFQDRRNAVVFATNPNGAEFDASITDESPAFNADWRGVWRVAAQRGPEGWSAEFAIPFRTLRYPDGSTAWGFNVERIIRRKNELGIWNGWSRQDGGFHRVSRAGTLEGLESLPRPALNLEVKPFGLLGANGIEGAASRGQAQAGLDFKYEVRPGLVLDATVRPDFAQVEADDQQINLTRFDLFFPEKRDFFLENAGIFEFGVRGYFEPPPFLLFFSRRIGIGAEGPTKVLGGGRLSGRAGRQTLGFLDVVEDGAPGQPRTNFGVVRVKRDIGASNYIGGIVADTRRGGEANTAAGVDWSFWPTGSLDVTGFVARTSSSGEGGDGDAYRLGLDYNVDRVGLSGQHLTIEPGARADMGFVTRTDIRRSEATGRVSFRPPMLGLRKVDLLLGGTYIANLAGQRQDESLGPALVLEWNSGDLFRCFVNRGRTRVPEAFDLGGLVPVPAADYEMRQLSFFGSTSQSRPLVLTVQGDLFHTLGGSVSSVGAGATVARNAHLALSVGYTRNAVDLPTGAFTANLASLRVDYAFSTRLFAHAFVQYNGLERKVFTNLRLSFIHRPGSDLYLVLNDEQGPGAGPSTRAVAAKLTYLMRF